MGPCTLQRFLVLDELEFVTFGWEIMCSRMTQGDPYLPRQFGEHKLQSRAAKGKRAQTIQTWSTCSYHEMMLLGSISGNVSMRVLSIASSITEKLALSEGLLLFPFGSFFFSLRSKIWTQKPLAVLLVSVPHSFHRWLCV